MNKRYRRGRRGGRRRKRVRVNITREKIQHLLHDKAIVYRQHNLWISQSTATQSNTPIRWTIPRVESSPGIIKDIIEATSAQTALEADTSTNMWIVRDIKTVCTVKNNEINPCIVEMYWCEWRDLQFTHTAGTVDTSTDDIRELAMYTLVTGWSQKQSAGAQAQYVGAGDLYANGDTSFFTANPFLTPFQSNQFCQAFKIKKVVKKRLAPQEQMRFFLTTPMVEYFDPQDDEDRKLGYKGITRFLLMMQHGDLGATAAAAPGYTTSELIFEFERKANVHLKHDSSLRVMSVVSVQGGTDIETQGFPAGATAVLGPTEMVMDDA